MSLVGTCGARGERRRRRSEAPRVRTADLEGIRDHENAKQNVWSKVCLGRRLDFIR